MESKHELTTQERISLGLGSLARELESLRTFVRDNPCALPDEDWERQLADKDAELVTLHEELDDLRSQVAGQEAAEHDLEAKIERLEGELADANDRATGREESIAGVAGDLCDVIVRALGVEKPDDTWEVFQIYRAVEAVRTEILAQSSLLDAHARLKQLQRECGARSFVEQLQKGA